MKVCVIAKLSLSESKREFLCNVVRLSSCECMTFLGWRNVLAFHVYVRICGPVSLRWWWLLLYSAILRSRADSLRSHVILHERLAYFTTRFWISNEVVYLQRWHSWCHMNLLPSRRVLCTPYNHVTSCKSHMRKVYACLSVTCHLHFWQDDRDRDLLRATAVTRGWNGYRNRSQYRKLTLEKKIPPQGFEPATFQSRVRRSNHWAIPAPRYKSS